MIIKNYNKNNKQKEMGQQTSKSFDTLYRESLKDILYIKNE